VCTGLYRQLHDISHFVERSLFSHHWHSAPASIGSVCRKGSVIKRLTYVQVRRKIREEHSASVHLSCQQFVVIAKWKKNSKFNDRREIVNLDKFGLSDWLDFGELNLGLREAYEKRGRGPCQVYAAAFHWSRHGHWRHRLECVVQKQGRHIEHLSKNCRMLQLLSTIIETINTLFPVVNFLKCVVTEVVIPQGSVSSQYITYHFNWYVMQILTIFLA